ncbi:MAG: hypothetical protein HOY71_48200 [Nonomuraea sp.]|nr:hypothetical protein [Nonomuraea sp.]
MGSTLRVAFGAALAAVAVGGLMAVPASASTPTPTNSPSPAASTATADCRYKLAADKDIPVRSGPGKHFRVVGVIPREREAPIFGTCVSPGRGPSHWIRVVQGRYEDAFVWRNYFDRM